MYSFLSSSSTAVSKSSRVNGSILTQIRRVLFHGLIPISRYSPLNPYLRHSSCTCGTAHTS